MGRKEFGSIKLATAISDKSKNIGLELCFDILNFLEYSTILYVKSEEKNGTLSKIGHYNKNL